jgi:tetratricopeptide (TPR) repeat protein
MKESLRQKMHESLANRETDDLLEIWQDGSDQDWQPEAFDVIADILHERLGHLPELSGARLAREAELQMQAGNLPVALETANRILQLRPLDAQVLTMRGEIYDQLECLPEALADFSAAVRIDPDHEPAWTNLRNLEMDLQQEFIESEAWERLDQVLEYAFEGDMQAAMQELERARQLLPEIGPAHNRLGMVLEELGETGLSVDCYLHAIWLNPRFYDARTNLANALVRLETQQYQLADQGALNFSSPEDDLFFAALEQDLEEDIDFDDDDDETEDDDQYEDEQKPVRTLMELPGWCRTDRPGFMIPGWPGYRFRHGRFGTDLLDCEFERGHLMGVIVRQTMRGRFRTRNPVYLFFMLLIGLFYSLLLMGVISPIINHSFLILIFSILYLPYGLFGIMLIVNALKSLAPLPADLVDDGSAFY